MIDKLKQIEDKLILELLQKPEIWKTLFIDYHPPLVERCWTQLGNYRLSLHFIHQCEPEDALFHPHPWPSAMRVLEGTYEMGLGFGKGLEKPEKMCTILVSNGMYYDMTHIDGWHYVRPVKSTCSTVMLTGPKWEREEIKSDKPLKELTPERKLIILDYFLSFYRRQYQQQTIFENRVIQRGDWVEIVPSMLSARERTELQKYFGEMAFVIKREGESLLDVRFKNNDRVQLYSYAVKLLDKLEKKKDIEKEEDIDEDDD